MKRFVVFMKIWLKCFHENKPKVNSEAVLSLSFSEAFHMRYINPSLTVIMT